VKVSFKAVPWSVYGEEFTAFGRGQAPVGPAGPPATPRTRAARVRDLSARGGIDPGLAADLERFNRGLGAGEDTLAAIGHLRRGAPAIVTGQQPGLALGPLFVLLKAVTAVSLARAAAAELARPVVPVFWVAGDDHDLSEVDRVFLLDAAGRPEAVRFHSEPLRGRPAGSIPAAMASLTLGQAAAVLRRIAPHGPEVAAFIERCRDDGGSLEDVFCRLLLRVTAGMGLVVLSPGLPAARRLAAPVLARGIEDGAGLLESADTATQELRRAGDGGGHGRGTVSRALVCWHGPYGRQALHPSGDGRLVHGDRAYETGEIRRRLDEEPHRFSPAALLRPAVQDAILPTLEHVCGPGEYGYLPAARSLYPLLDLGLPLLRPRLSLTLVPDRVARVLEGFDLDAADLVETGTAPAVERVLSRAGLAGYRDRFARAATELGRLFADLRGDLTGLTPSLGEIADRARDRALDGLDYLEERTAGQFRRRHRPMVRRLETAVGVLRPRGRPQEQVVSPLSFIAAHGWGLAPALAEAPAAGGHRLAFVDDDPDR